MKTPPQSALPPTIEASTVRPCRGPFAADVREAVGTVLFLAERVSFI
jgi:hypothetical protein